MSARGEEKPECRHIWKIVARRPDAVVAQCEVCPAREERPIGRRWGDQQQPWNKGRGSRSGAKKR